MSQLLKFSAFLGIFVTAWLVACASTSDTKPRPPRAAATACEEVPYTAIARKGMGTFSVKAADDLAQKLAADRVLPSLEAKAQFSRVMLLSSGKQASKDVLEQYFCRIKEKFPDRIDAIKKAESAIDGVLDHTFDGAHFTTDAGKIALDTWLKDEASAQLDGAPHPFTAAERAFLTHTIGSNNFTKLTETSADVKVAVAKYNLGACGSLLVASSASNVTAGLATSLGALDSIVASFLTGSTEGILLARKIRDGASAVYASVPEADALEGLGAACNQASAGK